MKKCALKGDSQKAAWYEEEFRKMDAEIIALHLARPALRALVNASVYSVKTLRAKSPAELRALHGMGPAALRKLQTLLR